ncbi:MAG: hypothetical protein R3D34_06870 [Nitratireductor sp.]
MARLQRFYGGNPRDWLETLPLALVRAFARMLPRLEAEETLRNWGTGSLAAGLVKPHEARRLRSQLSRAAGGNRKPVPATPQGLAMIGVAVTIVGPDGKEPSHG